MVVLMLTAILTVWLGIWGPLDLSRLEKWQTLTGSILAIGGVVLTAIVAVRNVRRQIRVNILSRKEDRIERLLPGLREAVDFASVFLLHRVVRGFIGFIEAFQSDGFGIAGSTFQKDVHKALPNTDGATRQSVAQRLYKCFNWGRIAENAAQVIRTWTAETSNRDEWEPSALQEKLTQVDRQRELLAQARLQFGIAMDELEAEINGIRAKISLYEARSSRIRRELETFFGDGI
jgi:hypothetical protein